VHGRLAESKEAGRMAGKSELQLELTDIVIGGTAYAILSSDYQVKGKSSGGRSAKRILGGTGLGAAIGAIAGNAGMGAAIGAVVGTTAPWHKRVKRSASRARRSWNFDCNSRVFAGSDVMPGNARTRPILVHR